ncbi:hypothetical protein ACFL6G_10145 [candidate division KSB1 bacterium]
MKIICLLLFIITFNIACNHENSDFPILKGPYIGQEPPGMVPEIFAPEIISTKDKVELNSVFSPDGKEFYFSRWDEDMNDFRIMVTRRINDIWTKPETAPFSGKFGEADISISPDGQRFFFCSKRPFPGSNEPNTSYHIWYMTRSNSYWIDPKPIQLPDGSYLKALHPTSTKNGILYFQARLGRTYGESDLYRSKLENGVLNTPENLGERVNSSFSEADVVISPDESFLIVVCQDRPEIMGDSDLYVGFRINGTWTELINMGNVINSEIGESSPMLSPDGKYLFFGRYDTEKDEDAIYWVSTMVIEEMKPDELKQQEEE